MADGGGRDRQAGGGRGGRGFRALQFVGDPYEMKNLAGDPSVQLKRDGLLATLRAAKSQLLDFKRR